MIVTWIHNKLFVSIKKYFLNVVLSFHKVLKPFDKMFVRTLSLESWVIQFFPESTSNKPYNKQRGHLTNRWVWTTFLIHSVRMNEIKKQTVNLKIFIAAIEYLEPFLFKLLRFKSKFIILIFFLFLLFLGKERSWWSIRSCKF